MAANKANSFDVVYPKRRLLGSAARGVLLWSTLASLLLCLILVNLYVILDMLAVARAAGEFSEVYWPARLAEWCRQSPLVVRDQSGMAILVLTAASLALLRFLMISRARTLANREGLDVATSLRRSIHRQRLRLGPGDLNDSEYDSVFGLFTTEADHVRDGVAAWLRRSARFPFELYVLIAFSIALHPLVAFQCLIPLAICWFLLQRELARARNSQRRLEDRSNSELKLLSESLRKTRLVRGFGMESYEHEQFQKHLDRFRNSIATLQRGAGWSRLAGVALILLGVALIVYLTGIKVVLFETDPWRLPLPGAIVLWVTFSLMYQPLSEIRKLAHDKENANLAASRIYNYIDKIPEVGQAVGAKFLQPLAKSIQFDAVIYAGHDKRVLLDKLDIKIPAGAMTAVVSLNPLEARAFMYLLPRFIEPQAGRVLYDGEDIAWVTLESLRAETIYVGGDDPFFTGTVRENISCGNEKYSLQDVTEAAKLTRAHNFILKLSSGYETVLGEHGERLDPGESMRLGLARAVLREPAVMIIDEPAAKLSDATKSLLDDAYSRIAKDRTVLFLPTRMSTLRRVDHVVVLHQGQVEAFGSRADLVQNSPVYRHWEYVNFNEFERSQKKTES